MSKELQKSAKQLKLNALSCNKARKCIKANYDILPGEEFQYIDPADEEMDDGFVFSPVSVFLLNITFHVLESLS